MKIFYESGKDMSSGNFVSFFYILSKFDPDRSAKGFIVRLMGLAGYSNHPVMRSRPKWRAVDWQIPLSSRGDSRIVPTGEPDFG